jgi:RHS repeat-associated protein
MRWIFSGDKPDLLDRLITVQQGSQTRTYNYDDAGRLTSKIEPESGTTSYAYEPWGGVYTRTDARGIVTTYSYDSLTRPTGQTYSDGTPSVAINYDETSALGYGLTNTKGRVSSQYAVSGGTNIAGEIFSYDQQGNVAINHQCTPRTCASGVFQFNYGYNNLGQTTSATNGEGVTFGYNYDAIGRFSSLSSSAADGNHPQYPVSSVSWNNAFGAPNSVTLGNGMVENYGFDPLGNFQSVSSSAYSLSLTTLPNGTVTSANDSVNGNWSYTYDEFNRLAAASKSGFAMQWQYDRYGNRQRQGGNGPTPSYTIDPTTNRVANFSYDANGNVTFDGTNTYAYDAENRMISTTSPTSVVTNYTYDAEGRRVKVATVGAATYDEFVYDLAGRVASEVDSNGAWIRGEIYWGGRRLATYIAGTTYFKHQDQVGNLRVITLPNGSVQATCTNLPFGDNSSCGSGYQEAFTDYERDAESGLDHSWFRQLSSTPGRFISPDPYEGSADITNPQSLNRYSYALNNPLSFSDPLGLWHCVDSKGNALPTYTKESDCVNNGGGWRPDPGDIPDSSLTFDGGKDQFPQLGPPNGSSRLNSGDDSSPYDGNASFFAPGSLAYLTFGPPSARLWNSADSWGKAAFIGTGAALASPFVAVGAAATPGVAVNIAARGTGWYYGLTGGTAGVVLGRYPEYIDAAESMGANALNASPRVFSFFNSAGQWWTLNQSFLNASIFRGQQFFLSNPPLGQEGSNFALELQYLISRGIGPQQWGYVPLRFIGF